MRPAARLPLTQELEDSTPSRSRHFIICALRTVSPTIAAIFGARK